MKTLEGTLVRMGENGVGVVDVESESEYVYFTPKQIEGYRGETVHELASPQDGAWVSGKTVVIEADVDASGNVQVSSVALK